MSPATPPDAKPTVLVLGATSLIGRFLLPLLKDADVQAVALSRSPPEGEALGSMNWLTGDLGSANLQEVLPQARIVISLSPIWLLPAALPALKAKGMQRLVAFSSTSVFTKSASDDPHERAVARDLDLGESETRLFCEDNRVAWTILRPTLIYAEGQDQNVTRLARLIKRFGVLPLLGQGQGRRQPVHAQDLAQAAINVTGLPAAFGNAYDLPGGSTLTYATMAARVFEGLGRKPRIFTAPPWLWRLAFRLAGPMLPGATAQMGERMGEDMVFSSDSAKQDFGWKPRRFHPDFKGVL